MAEWSNEKTKAVREYLFKNASVRLDYDRHVVGELRELNRHADTVNAWIVGLSTGAIGLMMTGLTKLENIPRWQAVIVFSPFVLSILSGLLFRWLMKETEAAEAFSGGKKQASLINFMLNLETLSSEEQLEHARLQLEQIAKDCVDSEQMRFVAVAHHWQKWTNRVYWIPSITFVLGVLTITILALIIWESPAAKPRPPVIPQIRRSRP
jgi:hypothetical protein